jgi:disulfide bond formation protein DsbB
MTCSENRLPLSGSCSGGLLYRPFRLRAKENQNVATLPAGDVPGLHPPAGSAHCGGKRHGRMSSGKVASMAEMAMKATWSEQLRREPAAAAALAVFAGSAATILGVWYFQYVLKLPPCPLCLEERLPYHIVVPLSLLLAIAAIVRAPRALIVVGFLAIVAAMLASAALGAYHAGVEWRWWPGPTDCSGPITDFTAKGPLLGQLQSIHVVRCDEAAWRFLGLSLAGYNVLISLALAAIAALGLAAHKEAA